MDNLFNFIKKGYTSFKIRNGFLVSLGLIFSLLGNSLKEPTSQQNWISLVLIIFSNYGLVVVYNHIILRLFLFKKRFLLFIPLFVAYMAIITLFVMYGSPAILNKPFKTDFVQLLPDVIYNTILISLFYFFHFYFLKFINEQDIQILNQKTEIDNLKLQLNPHFLLNSLNNLYGVSLTKPTEVPAKIIELTDLLKYQIETSKKDYNSLREEKIFIEKYIAYSEWKLQNITINSTETGKPNNFEITPMVFLPLVENAIKYSNFKKNPIIDINWNFSDTKFIFSISNAFQDNKSEFFSTKSGLQNLKKRLSLFHPDSKLEVDEQDNQFKVSISLWNLNILA